MTEQKKAIAFLGFTTLAFSSMELAGKLIADQMTPLQVTFLRFTIGFLILFPFALLEMHGKNSRIRSRDVLWLIALGICNIPVAMVLLQYAVSLIPASLAAVIISSNPIFVALFARLILKEAITAQTVIGLVVGIFGLTLVTDILHLTAVGNSKGIVAALGASVFFALYTVLSKKAVRRLGGLMTNTGSFFFGNLAVLCILLFRGEPLFRGLSVSTIGPILYLGIVVTGLAYLAFLRGLSYVEASKGSVIFFLKPIVASLLAMVILQERLESHMLIGTLFVIVGSVIMVMKKPKRQVTERIVL